MNLITGTGILSTLFKGAVNVPISVANLGNKVLKRKPYKPKSKIFKKNFKFNFGPFEFAKRKLLSY